jgi:hypothetical protein
MKTKLIKLMFQLFIVVITGIGTIIYTPNYYAQAASSSEELAKSYFNASNIILYLGEAGKETFDFDIKSYSNKNIAKYSWYIKAGKGNPEAITINSNTGLVTAKNIGTAYIRCKITFTDKTVIRPETKVTVRNNITGIELTNIPMDNTITAGLTVDFDTKILDTAAGKDISTSGIVRFELKDDTSGIGEVTDDGILTPSCSGEFNIRAVCFESTEFYQIWLENKEDHSNYVTATSNWITVKVLSTEATASTQKELNELLSSDIITKITITAKDRYFIISKDDYSKKTLVINTSDTRIENYATFKQIIITSTSNTEWNEYGTKNSFTLYDSDINFNINKQARVEYIKLDTASLNSVITNPYNNNIVININGVLKTLDVIASSDIAISGTEKYAIVNAMEHNTKISSSIPIILNLYADINASLFIGAEQSLIFTYGDLTGSIDNLTSDTLHIYNNKDIITLNPYQSLTINGETISYNAINTSMIVKQTPKVSSVVYASQITSGKTLSSSTLYGTFYYNSMIVMGTLSWCEPETVINSAGSYSWTFTPLDTIHYNTVTGKAYVSVIIQ